MDNRLLKHIPKDQKENFKIEFVNSRVRKTLLEVVTEMYYTIDRESKSLDAYDSAGGAWAYKRASYDGELRALTKVMNLMKGDSNHDRPTN